MVYSFAVKNNSDLHVDNHILILALSNIKDLAISSTLTQTPSPKYIKVFNYCYFYSFPSNHPNRHNIVIPVNRTKLRFHTDYSALGTWHGGSVQQSKHLCQFRSRIGCLLDLNRIEYAVMLQHNIDFFHILVAIIVHIGFHTTVQICLRNLSHNIIFQYGTVHGSTFQSFRTAPFSQIAY